MINEDIKDGVEEIDEEKQIPVADDNIDYPFSEKFIIQLPKRFINLVTSKIFVLPVIAAEDVTCEAVHLIQYFLDSNDDNASKGMVFHKALYDEIRNFFASILLDGNLEFLHTDEYAVERKLIFNYAAGITQSDDFFLKICKWYQDNDFYIENIESLPEAHEGEALVDIDFFNLMGASPELQKEIEANWTPCCQGLSINCYTAPVMGYLGSLYPVIAISDQNLAMVYATGLGFATGALGALFRCQHFGSIFVGGMSGVCAVAVTALKYACNVKEVLIIGGCATIGVPLLIYGGRHIAFGNWFNMWRAVPSTPQSTPNASPHSSVELSSRRLSLSQT